MDFKRLMETAILAGTIMMESNAETYRVEDTMNRILRTSNLQTAEAFAITTGLFATLDDPSIAAITIVKRITYRDTNLNKIAKVNTISRRLVNKDCSLEEAYEALQHVHEAEYQFYHSDLAIIALVTSFSLLLGGGVLELLFSLVTGTVLVLARKGEQKAEMSSFMRNLLSSILIAATAALIGQISPAPVNVNILIIAAIMPMVPGTAITNAIRDTFQGDYMSGGAKALEAIMIAFSIALGVALGILATGGIAF